MAQSEIEDAPGTDRRIRHVIAQLSGLDSAV